MSFLSAQSLVKVLPSGGRQLVILDRVDLEIKSGEFLAIVGPSGSGKSTLLGLLAGLDRPTSGSVTLDGEAIESASEDALALVRRNKVGFVFQSFQLLANLTASENVALPMELLGRSDAAERAATLLASVGLEERGHHYPIQLSGGEQQRVALARAFAPDPKILFADEPTGNLDSASGKIVLRLLESLRAELGTTLVLVTHDESVAALADRVVRIEDGRIVSDAASTAQPHKVEVSSGERNQDGSADGAAALPERDQASSAIGSEAAER